jgi:hypothetical protein
VLGKFLMEVDYNSKKSLLVERPMNHVWFHSQYFQKAIITFVMSIYQHWTSRLTLTEFSFHLISEYFFFLIFREDSRVVKIWEEYLVLSWRRVCMYDNMSLISSQNEKYLGQKF